ncbi:MAG: hotdog fold thioesterase [Thermodesulfobacteriota bacterium]
MKQEVKVAIFQAVNREPFARGLGLELIELDDGYSLVEMTYDPETMDNIYQRAHGGAVFGLIDEAFETAGQTDGTIAVALNVNITYVASPEPGDRLRAEAREVSRTRKTIVFDLKVTDQNGGMIATCQALAYRTGKPIPFLPGKPVEHRDLS